MEALAILLGIIALKHTHHFVRAHARRKRA